MAQSHGVLAQLVVEGEVGRVTNGITEVVAASMAADRAPETTAEIKRRFDMCIAIFCELRADLKWPIERILDMMPVYLRCRLDGAPYNPEADARRAMWGAGQGDPLQRDEGLRIELPTPAQVPLILKS